MKVSQIPYRRYTIEQVRERFDEFCRLFESAKSADDVIEARRIIEDINTEFGTAASLAANRFCLNSNDEFYKTENDYYDEVTPYYQELLVKYSNMMLTSPYRAELEQKINPLIFRHYEVAKKAFSEAITELSQQENAVVTEYSAFMSKLIFNFDGEDMPLSVIRGKLEDTDREVRRRAAVIIGEGLGKHSKELDGFYDKLVHIRDNMAKKMGYKSYVELGYYRMGRIDYDADMVKCFRDNVKQDLVPCIEELEKKVAKKLGIDKIQFYDSSVFTKGESPNPILDKEGIFKAAADMYNEMDPEVGQFMHDMLENEAFDVDARDGKWGGGYCTHFPKYKQPFILANFNGTSGDVEVITHEFGHALADYFVFKQGDLELEVGGMETAECHSMSMEFLTWPYMDRFFGKNTDEFKYKHLLSSLTFIPYGVMVDEFQHIVYENPDMTPAQRNDTWLSLEAKYRPYLHYDDIPYLSNGTRWQYQMHIFQMPFYYIDYCLAQTVAFGFLAASEQNYADALARYLDFSRTGGQKHFADTVHAAGMPSPFDAGALKNIVKVITSLADSIEAKL